MIQSGRGLFTGVEQKSGVSSVMNLTIETLATMDLAPKLLLPGSQLL